MFSRLLTVLLGLAFCVSSVPAIAQQITGTKVPMSGDLVDNDEDESEALSGIACAPPAGDGSLKCLIAIDEGIFAQWATLTLDPPSLTFDAPVQLYEAANLNGIPGSLPATSCPGGPGAFNEHDSEGAALLDGDFYLAASHGCGRKKMRFKQSAFVDIKLAPPYGTANISHSLRLNPVLVAQQSLASGFGKDVRDGNGISIEGVAAHGGGLYFGLRSPLVDGKAVIVEVPAGQMFAAPESGDTVTSKLHFASLGEMTGVRDIAALGGGSPRFLILSGDVAKADGTFAVALFVPGANGGDGTVTPVANLEVPNGERAEGMAVVRENGQDVTVLILFDKGADGDPHLFDLTLP